MLTDASFQKIGDERSISRNVAALNILIYDVINLFDLLTLNRQTKIILH